MFFPLARSVHKELVGPLTTPTNREVGISSPTSAAPTLDVNAMTLGQGDTVTLSALILSASDVDTVDSTLQFTVSSVTNGQFENTGNTGVAITQFLQSQVSASEIVFVHDNSSDAPTYSVVVSDGVGDSGAAQAATITFSPTAPSTTGTTTSVLVGDGQEASPTITAPSGTDTVMVVIIQSSENDNTDGGLASAVSYGGSALTLAVRSDNNNDTTRTSAEIWYLDSPTAGSATLSYTLNGTPNNHAYSVRFLQNAEQGGPSATAAVNGATVHNTSPYELSITTSKDSSLVVSACNIHNNTALNANSSQSEVQGSGGQNQYYRNGVTSVATAGSHTDSWTSTQQESAGHAAAAWGPAGSAGGGVQPGPSARWELVAQNPTIVEVSTSAQLTAAIAARVPGTQILLQPGQYAGNFVFRDPATTDELNGTADNPIGLWCKGDPHTAVIVGGSSVSTIRGIATKHTIFDGLRVVGSANPSANDDASGFKFTRGSNYNTENLVAGILIRNNRIEGTGTDSIKFGTAVWCVIVGNIIEGDVGETGVDVVTGHGCIGAYNTVTSGVADGFTFKTFSQDNWLHHNLITPSSTNTAVYMGGHGGSYANFQATAPVPQAFLDGAFHCRHSLYEDNYLDSNGKAVVLAGSQFGTVRNNYLGGLLKETDGNAANGAKFDSRDNTITNNTVSSANWYTVDAGQGTGTTRSGNVQGNGQAILALAGADKMPASYLDWKTSGTHLSPLTYSAWEAAF